MNLNDFKRLIRPVKNKIFLLLGRAVLKLVSNAETTQKLQVIALADETISDIERFQEYGFETYPWEEGEVFIGFLNGNRDHGIALCVHDGRYRPIDLVQGEVAIYTDEDATTPFRIQMKRNRIHFRRSDKEDIDIDTSKTEDIGTSKTVTVPTETHTNLITHVIDSKKVVLGDADWVNVRKLVDSRFKDLFDAHVHANGGGIGNSGVPTVLMGDAHMTDNTRAI